MHVTMHVASIVFNEEEEEKLLEKNSHRGPPYNPRELKEQIVVADASNVHHPTL